MSAHVKGLAELQAFLDTLTPKMEANIMRGAMRQGANVIKAEAKQNIPVKSGLLRDGLKVSTRLRRGVVTASVKTGGKHGYVARWAEYGTAAHTITAKNSKELFFGGFFSKSVHHPGITNPKPFMRPALNSKAQEALLAVGEAVKTRLAKQGLDVSGVELGAS